MRNAINAKIAEYVQYITDKPAETITLEELNALYIILANIKIEDEQAEYRQHMEHLAEVVFTLNGIPPVD